MLNASKYLLRGNFNKINYFKNEGKFWKFCSSFQPLNIFDVVKNDELDEIDIKNIRSGLIV